MTCHELMVGSCPGRTGWVAGAGIVLLLLVAVWHLGLGRLVRSAFLIRWHSRKVDEWDAAGRGGELPTAAEVDAQARHWWRVRG